MSGWQSGPDAAAIEALARAALERIPSPFRDYLGPVVIRVEEQADPETLAHFGLTHPLQLSGLYTGIPVGEKSVEAIAPLPDMIRLYRRALLAESEQDGVPLAELVSHVLVHEIGHHFGLSDEDMHRLEALATDEQDG